jgi:PAS domain S-box-containing protein
MGKRVEIDRRLEEQRRHLDPLLRITPTATVISDLDATVVAWSPAAERLFGYTAEEAIGRNLDDLVARTEELHEDAVAYSRRAGRERDQVHLITRRTTKDGSLVDVELLASPLLVDGEVVGTLGIYHDITTLNRQRRFLESLLQVSPEAIVTTDLEDRVVSWNPAAEKLFGYTTDEAVGRPVDELVARRGDLRAEGTQLNERASRGETARLVTQRTRKDGTLVDVDIVGGPVTVGGEIVAKHVIYHDITELQERNRYFEALLEVSPTAIVVQDLDANVTSWNPAAERLFGYTAEEAIGRNLDDVVANRPDLHEEAAEFSRAGQRREGGRAVSRRTRKDGSLVDVELIFEPVVVGDQHVGFVVVYHDIGEIQQQKRYLESVLDVSPAAIITVDKEHRVTRWNPAAEQLFGYTAKEAVGLNLDDLVGGTDALREEARRFSEEESRGRKTRAITRRSRKDGSLVDVQILGTPVVVGGERVGHAVVYHDIGDIQRQRRYYETLLEASPVAVALLDHQAVVTSWNPAAEKLFGYTAEEAIGRNIDELVARHEEIRGEAEEYSVRGRTGRFVHAFTKRSRKDGELVDVELLAVPVVVGGEDAGFYVLYHDITELQRARRDAEAATHAKSAFLATMSHEIRTPLNAVIGMTGLLLDTPLSEEQRKFAEVIRGSGDALLGVINDILDFSKIEAGRFDLESAPFDLRECVESALELVAAAAVKKGLDLAYDLDPEAPGALVGDVTRLRQILINLLNNAVKFTERGEVVVTVTAERLDWGDRHRLHFAVRDTGIGIPREGMDLLFESFSQIDPSTTRRYGGTGLGLAISMRLAELMNGRMWAESQEGEGSTFHFTIEGEAAPAQVRNFERGGAPQLEGRRVMIVDDNATNRHILVKQTTSWGMITRETESPATALEWVHRGDPLDVAILDMQMPDMDGLSLARQIRLHRDAGALPLVMLTSLGQTEDASGIDFAAYLTKPIKPSDLFDTLLGVFGGAPPEAEQLVTPTEGRLGERLPMKILVVEDNAMNQQLALLMLRKMGYRADVAANGVEALEALDRQPYDLVLMDVEMPEMDGLEATRRIHQRMPAEGRPYIVAVTANAMQGERELCLQAGMDDYITKPIYEEVLTEALTKAARRVGSGARAQVLDPVVIRRLVSSFGEQGPDAVSTLIGTFLDHAAGVMARMRAALEQRSLGEVRREAHTLKSNALTFGAASLADLCEQVQADAKSGSLVRAEELMPAIAAELDRVVAALGTARSELVP